MNLFLTIVGFLFLPAPWLGLLLLLAAHNDDGN